MEILLTITTPKGQAKGFSDKLKLSVGLGFKYTCKVNDENNRIDFALEGTPNKCYAFQKKAYNFKENAIKAAKVAIKVMDRKKQQELIKMLDETSISIKVTKEPTAEEILNDRMSFWEKMKNKLGIK